MEYLEFLQLVVLLLKYRAAFAMSHRFRNAVDEIALDCLGHLQSKIQERQDDKEIPF